MKIKSSLQFILLIATGLAAAASQLTSSENTISLVIGHLSFSLNMLIITVLAQLAMGSLTSNASPHSKRKTTLIFVLGGLKFLILIGLLFAAIVVYEMPPLFIGIGALVGLVTFLWLYIIKYLKGMSSETAAIP